MKRKKFFKCGKSLVFRTFSLLIILAILLPVNILAASAPNDEFYFKPGDRHIYQLCWGVIPAGYAVLEVHPFQEINGDKAWHFSMSVRTCKFIDMFYKVRDSIESFTDMTLSNSLIYRKKQREGSTNRNVEVVFDQKNKTATYINHGEKRDPIEIVDGTIDPLASLFFVRNQPIDILTEINRPITDGKKNVIGTARVVGREKVFLDDQTYDTFIIEPDMRDVRGVFEKDPNSNIRLWITADERRLLVKIKSKVIVGSFTATLVQEGSSLAKAALAQ